MKNIELTNWVSLFQEVAHEGFAEFKTVIKDENNNEFELSKIYKNNKDKTVEIIFQEHDNKKINDMNELEKEYEKLINDYEMLDNCNRIHENEIIEAKEIIKRLLATPRSIYGRDEDGELTSFFNPDYEELKKQAEQFLKEMKEK